MRYLVDGYNLLFRNLDEEKDFQNQRNILIRALDKKATLLNLSITIVFDAHYQLGIATRSHLRTLEIVYTGYNETADQLIINILRTTTTPQETTVVTSDKKLAWLAKRCDAKTLAVDEFLTLLNRRTKNKQTPPPPQRQTLAPRPSRSKPAPSSSTPAEECASFYLEIFEKKHAEAAHEEEQLHIRDSLKPSLAKKKKRPPRPQPPLEDDMSRWLRLFTQNKPEDLC